MLFHESKTDKRKDGVFDNNEKFPLSEKPMKKLNKLHKH